MIFSLEFGITKTTDDDWFDPILSMDTKLFIDPFLVFESNHPYFPNTHQKTIDFFDMTFKIAAKSKGNSSDLRYRQLLSIMKFPEVQEVCLGYASRSTSGAGAGGGFSRMIVDSIYDSIKLGITNFERFEEIGLFNQGFGCDRISDMTATLLKSEIIDYTKSVCQRHSIPTEELFISQARFDARFGRWVNEKHHLPINPYTGKAIFLVPKKFLRELPTISAEEFWDFCWINLNEELRDNYSIEIKGEIKKSEIIEIARQNPSWISDFEQTAKDKGSEPYDLVSDPKGYYIWVLATDEYVSSNSYKFIVAKNDNEFDRFVDEMIEQFAGFIENNSGYKLLWDDNGTRGKREEASQLLFTGIVKHYCKANNIDLSREPNLGRGPVDFKFSSGYSNRALIEVKLARNSVFWNGLEKQLVKYLEVEEIKKGYFIVICYSDADFAKVKDIQTIADKVALDNNVILSIIVIDATPDKPSASKL